MDGPELMAWWDHYQQEPWGHAIENLRAGTIATAVLTPHFKKYQIPKPGDWFKPAKDGEDSGKDNEPQQQSEEEIRAVFEKVAANVEAKAKRKKKQ